MFKFLRKYNKWILAVGGGLLMIVFLLGETLPNLMQNIGAQAAVRATVGDGERVPARLWQQYEIEAGMVRDLEQQFGQPVLPIGRLEGTEHWYLLVREAEKAGLVSEPGSIHVSSEALDGLSARGIGVDTYRQYAANLEGVGRLFELYLYSGETSDHRLRNFASRIFHTVRADVAVISASADHATVHPSEAELAEHLERFKDYEPGEGPMGLGYKLPDRAKIEWIEISANAVRETIAASEEMDGVALRRHWLSDPHGTFPTFERGAAVPFVVREDLLDNLTSERLDRIVNYVNAQLSTSRRGLEQREGYFILPDDWSERRVPLPQLAQAIQEREQIPLPSYHSTGDRWLRMAELEELPGIGNASTDRFGAPRSLADLVAASKELQGSTTVLIQEGIAGPPLRGPNGSVFVFRILDTDPARAPREVDEVRSELVADLRRIAAFEDLIEHASVFKQTAINQGMLPLAIEFDAELAQQPIQLASVELARMFVQFGQSPQILPTDLPILGRHRETIENIIDHARALPDDVPMDEIPLEDRVLVIPVEDRLAMVIVRINDQEPLSREKFTEIAAEGIAQQILFAEELEGLEHLLAAFGLETLSAKHNLQIQRARDAEDDVIELES